MAGADSLALVDDAPVFLLRGMRTGGSAVVEALGHLPGLCVYYQALHPDLALPYSTIAGQRGRDWAPGRHPRDLDYWGAFAPLVVADRVAGYEARFARTYAFPGGEADPEIVRWFSTLVAAAQAQGRRAVIGLEPAEGMLDALRAAFPQARFVGLTREAAAVRASWLELHRAGNDLFFDVALEAMRAEPEAYGVRADDLPRDVRGLGEAGLVELFDRYHAVTDAVRRERTDACASIEDLTATDAAARTRAWAEAMGLTRAEHEAVVARLATTRLTEPRDASGAAGASGCPVSCAPVSAIIWACLHSARDVLVHRPGQGSGRSLVGTHRSRLSKLDMVPGLSAGSSVERQGPCLGPPGRARVW